MYKHLRLAAFLVLVSMVPAFSQNFVEDQINFTKGGKISHTLNASVGANIHGKLGWYFWGCTSKGWSEAYPGLTYAPFSWMQVGAGYGFETDHDRLGSMLWLGKGPVSFIGFWEKGASYWHRVTLNVVVLQKGNIGLGAMNETLLIGRRTGPRLEGTWGKLRFWGAYMDKDFTIFGVNVLF